VLAAILAAPKDVPTAFLCSCGAGVSMAFTNAVDVLSIPAPEWRGAFARLAGFLERHRARRCVGYLGYDLRDDVEELPRTLPQDVDMPCLWFAAFDEWQVLPETTWPAEAVSVAAARDVRLHLARADYERRVAAIVEHVRAGDLFQANLSQPFTATFDGDPLALFARLCAVSPAPFAAYLGLDARRSVLSSSPEEFLRLDGRDVATRPIKGTRQRSSDAATDRALLAELLDSAKDRAELAMIVDLMRNDLGKVAAVGSVRVGPFPEHASYAQVHHLFATVTARLRDDVGIVDLLRATFPGGSITGAPKLRAMEILEEQEIVRRGVYTGAIGWIGPGANLHLNVAIRTLVRDGTTIRGNVGGGITAQSDPAAEYEETLHKAAGMWRALQASPERA
jgi:para-aminobenzoate synthetase component 1